MTLFWYWIEHVNIELLYVKFVFSTGIFYKGVPWFASDCPYGFMCRGLTTCLLCVGPLFRNLVSNDSWFLSLTKRKTHFSLFFFNSVYWYAFTYILTSRDIITSCLLFAFFTSQIVLFICQLLLFSLFSIDVVLTLSSNLRNIVQRQLQTYNRNHSPRIDSSM